MVTIDDSMDFELVERDSCFEVAKVGKIIPLEMLEGKSIDLLDRLGQLYEQNGVAATYFMGKAGSNIHAFYRLENYENRSLQVIGMMDGSSLEKVRVYGRLLDYAHLFRLRENGVLLGMESPAVVQEFKTMSDGKIISYNPTELHKLLAREVPLLRF